MALNCLSKQSLHRENADAISLDSEDRIGTEASRDWDKLEVCLGSEGNKTLLLGKSVFAGVMSSTSDIILRA